MRWGQVDSQVDSEGGSGGVVGQWNLCAYVIRLWSLYSQHTFLSLSLVCASSVMVSVSEWLALCSVEVSTSQGNPLVKRGVALHNQPTTEPASTTPIRSNLSITRPCSYSVCVCVCVCVCVWACVCVVYLVVLGIELC